MLTIDHLRAFHEEATGKPSKGLEGTTNGIDWHMGPPPERGDRLQTTCPDCFREITSGMTVYRPEAPTIGNAYYRRSAGLPTAIYVCAACFDWARHVKSHHTTIPYAQLPKWMKPPSVRATVKALDDLTPEVAPRFHIVGRPELLEDNYGDEPPNSTAALAIAAARAQKRLRQAA